VGATDSIRHKSRAHLMIDEVRRNAVGLAELIVNFSILYTRNAKGVVDAELL
jgi:hypothetical protein